MTDSNMQFMNELENMGGGHSNEAPVATEDKIQYSSHPVLNYRIGTKYVFENGLLTLDSEQDEKEFLTLLHSKKFPARDRAMIKKLDFQAAQRISQQALAKRPHTTQQIDSSIGERPNEAPRVGTGDLLGDASKLGIAAAGEGGREQNVPGAPDSNRETQTEPSPQPRPETPFRAEEQGKGGDFSAEQLSQETGGATDADPLSQPNANDAKATDAAAEAKPATPFGGLPQADKKG